ncbi:hypothetical protein WJX74_005005 [Apatococcus lobatus]|uniref:Uncharacterized protein n=1 Tax=Apatococcus lobatus TaxID=904363 RepID=A0AAW1S5N6_9CHLO
MSLGSEPDSGSFAVAPPQDNVDLALEQAEKLLGIATTPKLQPWDQAARMLQADSNEPYLRRTISQPQDAWALSAINSKAEELMHLRHQHQTLMDSTNETRRNWEAALASKDRAIAQLGKALEAHSQAARNEAASPHVQQQAPTQAHIQGIMVEAQKEAAAQSREAAAAAARAEAQRLSQQQMQLDIQQRVVQQHEQLAQLQEQNQAFKSTLEQVMQAHARDSRRHSSGSDLRRSAPTSLREAGGKQQQQLVQELQSQMAQAQAQLALKDASNKKYKDAVRALRARLSSAATALEQSEQKAHRLEASLVQQSPARPSRQLQEAQAQLFVCEQRIEVLKNELRQQQQETESVQQALGRAASHAETVAEELQESQSRCSKHEQGIARHKQRTEDAEDRAEQHRREASAFRQQVSLLKERLTDAQKRSGEQQEGTEEQLADAERRRQDAQAEAKSAQLLDNTDFDHLKKGFPQWTLLQETLKTTHQALAKVQSQLAEAHERIRAGENSRLEQESALQALKLEQGSSARHQQEAEVALQRVQHTARQEVAAARTEWDMQHRLELQQIQDARLEAQKGHITEQRLEGKVRELEEALQQSATTVSSVRQALAEQSQRASGLEAKLSSASAAGTLRDRALTQLKEQSLLQNQQHAQVQHALQEQAASYATALQSAEQRFSDLEAVVRRMAARTVAGCC